MKTLASVASGVINGELVVVLSNGETHAYNAAANYWVQKTTLHALNDQFSGRAQTQSLVDLLLKLDVRTGRR